MILVLVFPTKYHPQVFRLGHIAMLQLVQGELETAVADHFLKKQIQNNPMYSKSYPLSKSDF